MADDPGTYARQAQYYDAIYTQAEKDARDAQVLSDLWKRLGVSAPATREEFLSLIRSKSGNGGF